MVFIDSSEIDLVELELVPVRRQDQTVTVLDQGRLRVKAQGVPHLAVSENATGAARKLHAPASVIGQMASQSGAKILVLSHFMSRSLKDLDNSLVKIRLQFSGNVILAEDLQCIEAGQSPG